MEKTLAEFFKHDFSKGTFRLYDKNGNVTYFENSDGYWWKYEYDENGSIIYSEDSNGDWWKSEYDENGNKTYYKNSNGYWQKREYDENGNETYFENSKGKKRGFSKNDVLELTVSEIEEKYGKKVKIVNKK